MKKILTSFLAVFAVLGMNAQEQEYGVVNISVCNMRATANFDAEMVSQALLGTSPSPGRTYKRRTSTPAGSTMRPLRA